jgi:hypothetical protein
MVISLKVSLEMISEMELEHITMNKKNIKKQENGKMIRK